MQNLPKIRENNLNSEDLKKNKSENNNLISTDKKQKWAILSYNFDFRINNYDYFNTRLNKNVIEALLKMDKDDRFIYFLKYGILRRFEGEAELLFVEIPQIPKKIVVYRRPIYRQKTYDRLYLNNLDLPHIPLFEGEESLKLLSLENNSITKIDHLVSLNNLLYLNLYANKIYDIENLHTVPKLRALMLGKNIIEKIKNLNSLTELEVLDLHSNKIKLLENLGSLKKLRLLNVANNQITAFSELISNKTLEEINLRKNLIVSIPNLLNTLDKLKKINLGKNMISKIEFLLELKRVKSLSELIIEDNPVLLIKESIEIIKLLPIKIKIVSPDQTPPLKRESNSLLKLKNIERSAESRDKIREINLNKKDVNDILSQTNVHTSLYNSPAGKLKRTSSKIIMDLNRDKDLLKSKNNQEIINNNVNIDLDNNNAISNIITHIEKEWVIEYNYIIENEYNGYNTKRLKESKIVSGHAELEGNYKLNIYGNALEVLDQDEFYLTITTISFEYFNIDLISNKKILEKLKKFTKLNKLNFSNNNIHSFYQFIKFEELVNLISINVSNNEICGVSLLKSFLIYRFQNLKYFNELEITQKDIYAAKKVYEYFDKCISNSESKINKKNILQPQLVANNKNKLDFQDHSTSFKDENNGKIEMISELKQGITPLQTQFLDKNILQNKSDFFNFVKDNLLEIMEELIDNE